jgi:thioredoxin 2
MNDESITVECPGCGTRNRVPKARWGERPKCGKCKEPLDLSRLYPDRPIDVADSNFQAEVGMFPGPVLVDFTALW